MFKYSKKQMRKTKNLKKRIRKMRNTRKKGGMPIQLLSVLALAGLGLVQAYAPSKTGMFTNKTHAVNSSNSIPTSNPLAIPGSSGNRGPPPLTPGEVISSLPPKPDPLNGENAEQFRIKLFAEENNNIVDKVFDSWGTKGEQQYSDIDMNKIIFKLRNGQPLSKDENGTLNFMNIVNHEFYEIEKENLIRTIKSLN
jgi:hypothetical protein